MALSTCLKAYLFYILLHAFLQGRLNQPFSESLVKSILAEAKVSMGIGVVYFFGHQYGAWLETQNVVIPNLALVYLDGAGVWI